MSNVYADECDSDADLVHAERAAEAAVKPGTESFNPKKTFVVKDSGDREQYASGMHRDTSVGKLRPDLIKDGPMYLRWVALMTRGAIKYDARNWMKAAGQAEYDRFLESADRHYEIWYFWRKYGVNIEDWENPTNEPLKEDHAAAVIFNMNGTEYTADRLDKPPFAL